MDIDHRYLTRHEVAARIGVTTMTVFRWCHVGVYGVRLKVHRFGSRLRFLWVDVAAFQRAVDARRPRKRAGTFIPRLSREA